ncbi:MAG: phage tail protein [Deltaproteobacteria bacterium]|nr:phage tail protein [Deltaproteobacteria bacterium]MCB2187693.1 phage tail protein [Deltaproteobacteria bacterium]
MANNLQSLLPPSITHDAQMQGAAAAAGDEQERIRTLIPLIHIWSRLGEAPEAVLDHLAWHLHLDGYEFADSRALKQWLVEHFHDWHRYKGTVHGLALYWRVLLNRRLLSATPPHKFYWGKTLTQAEQEAFEAPHPEIRLYPFRHRTQSYCLCWGGMHWGRDAYVHSDALLRVGDRVALYDPLTGRESNLHSLLYETAWVERLARQEIEVRLPGGPGRGMFWGAGGWPNFWVDQEAGQRLYTLHLDRPYQDLVERRTPLAARPGLTPFSTYYQEVREPTLSPGGVFWANKYPDEPATVRGRGGACFWGGGLFWAERRAGDRLYKRFKLFDPTRVSQASRRASLFWGAFSFGGMPAHTAQVAVDMLGPAPKRGLNWGAGLHWGTSHYYVSDAADQIARVCQVGRLTRRRSDKILLAITNRQPVTASPGVLAGAARAGEYRLEVF